jgi:predicted RNase H-like HicB family nuclease
MGKTKKEVVQTLKEILTEGTKKEIENGINTTKNAITLLLAEEKILVNPEELLEMAKEVITSLQEKRIELTKQWEEA